MSQINETAIKTPGVYTTEIPLFPPSVAQVDTAVPAFIGYTEIAERKGESLRFKPTEITSLVDFRQLFGGPYTVSPGDFTLNVDPLHNYVVTQVAYTKMYYLFDALRLFFDNGGGKCYIVSVGGYTDNVIAGDETLTPPTGLRGGVKAIEVFDEPTLILFPDAVQLDDTAFFALQQMALSQCAALQDRFCVFDTRENNTGTTTPWKTSVSNFKDRIGINALNYAACYTPWLISSFTKDIGFSLLDDHVFDTPVPPAVATKIDLANLTSVPATNALVTSLRNNNADQTVVTGAITTLVTDGATVYPSVIDRYNKLKNDVLKAADGAPTETALDALMDYIELVMLALPPVKTAFVNVKLKQAFDDFAKDPGAGLAKFLSDLVALEKNADAIVLRADNSASLAAYDPLLALWIPTPPPPNTIATIPLSTTVYNTAGSTVHTQALNVIGDLDGIINGVNAFINKLLTATASYVKFGQDALYKSHPVISNWVLFLQRELSKLPPSGAVAGVYALIDGTRGVWKAPANVSLNSVVGPSVIIDNVTQDTLNIDDVAGKSINAIRAFTGKGTLVWGARTLDGNSSEWRYISVRRLFIMVEESAKKATFPFVFEPNDANTWVKVRAMLENYLTLLWRQGALAGAKPEQAFFVKCGLGQTMTAQDILDGKLIVEIAMAAVRPAEFIILRFEHKLQES
ncbi:phage tail sheath C-terminal domain-containing protein [Chitinophaga sp. MM2321]|uniref:phage tail sheath family protein n=1 Tax=Chitinophaga sp. MM2321 TaxID=3137178 RepID=UPI0032D5AF2C